MIQGLYRVLTAGPKGLAFRDVYAWSRLEAISRVRSMTGLEVVDAMLLPRCMEEAA